MTETKKDTARSVKDEFYFGSCNRKCSVSPVVRIDARALTQDDSWTGLRGTAAVCEITTITNTRFKEPHRHISPCVEFLKPVWSVWVYPLTLSVHLKDTVFFFLFTKSVKDPSPDVPAVFGFSHGVGTFSPAADLWCVEGRCEEALGSTAHPTIINFTPEFDRILWKMINEKIVQ